MSDNKVNYEVVDTTLQLIYEYNLDGGKREELVQSVIRMASNPHVSVTMKILCLWEIGNDVEMFRFMQEKFRSPALHWPLRTRRTWMESGWRVESPLSRL